LFNIAVGKVLQQYWKNQGQEQMDAEIKTFFFLLMQQQQT
jgi:hypothetical protein